MQFLQLLIGFFVAWIVLICFLYFYQVIVTEKAGHAFDVMASTADRELNSFDGIIAVVSKFRFRILFTVKTLSNHKLNFLKYIQIGQTSVIENSSDGSEVNLFISIKLYLMMIPGPFFL